MSMTVWSPSRTWTPSLPQSKYASLEASQTIPRLCRDLVFVGAIVCGELNQLTLRMRVATDKSSVPVLRDLLATYDDMCKAIKEAIETGVIYLSCCRRVLDPTMDMTAFDVKYQELDPLKAFNDFVALCDKVSPSIAYATACWEVAGPSLKRELKSFLDTSTSWGWGWIVRVRSAVSLDFDCATSRHIGLLDDLPLVTMDAKWHLRQLGYLWTTLGDTMKQMESATVAQGSDAFREELSRGTYTAFSEMSSIMVVFIGYQKHMAFLRGHAF
ncbi:hypothetical protein FB451DRAFT_1422695 [Mycena latifolia]|nr:hypothetical protein FB451DRAFT_1422695 [Mycena latifolia]